MAIIKYINETNHQSYDTEESIYNIISYIFNVGKTMYDSVRPGHILGEFIGCSRFLGTDIQEKDAVVVAENMIINNKVYGKPEENLIKHRVISFDELDYVLPEEAFKLAQYIANAYGENYITAYSVHLDCKNIHIHLAINTISWRDGKRFSVSFEKRWLSSLVNNWLKAHDESLIKDICAKVRYEKYVGF